MPNSVIDSYRPSYHSLGSFALSPQLQYILVLEEGATLNGKGVYPATSSRWQLPSSVVGALSSIGSCGTFPMAMTGLYNYVWWTLDNIISIRHL